MPNKIESACDHCGKSMQIWPSERIGRKSFCSNACAGAARRLPAPEARECAHCGGSFVPIRTNLDARYCSRRCWHDNRNVVVECIDCKGKFSIPASLHERNPSARRRCSDCRPATAPNKGQDSRIAVPCTHCGESVLRYPSQLKGGTGRVFCSIECRNTAGAKPRKQEMRTCQQCGDEFYPKQSGNTNRFCSKPCFDLFQTQRNVATCQHCNGQFEARPSRAPKYCSKDCRDGARKVPAGTRRGHRDGYVVVFMPGHSEAQATGWAFEHRVKMADLLKRPLTEDENVHHVNGDKTDNTTDGPLVEVNGHWRSGNLELWTRSQPYGQRVSDKIAWARQILEQYGEKA